MTRRDMVTKKKTGFRGWFTRGRIIGAGVVTGALVLAGGGIAWASASGTGSGYRTAVAETGSVDETLSLSGALASATRRDRAFAASGTVTAVNVKVGDTVAAGDVLATIDDSALQDAVDAAASKLATAQQTLADDLASQSSTSSSASSSAASSATASTPSGSASGSGGTSGASSAAITAAVARVKEAQQNLLTLAAAANTALADAQSSLADSATVCQPFLDASLVADADPADPADPADVDPTAGTDDADPSALTLEAVQQLLVACQQAIAGTGDTQAVVQAAQSAVQAAMAELDTAITELTDAAGAASGGGAGSSGSSGGSASASGSSSAGAGSTGSGGASGGSKTASAADIVADQAEVALAQANLDIAQHELGAASLTTPIAGTVAAVGFAVGDAVSAGSTTQVVTIIGDDGYTISATVTLAQIAKVQVGQTGAAVITSSGASYAATVSSVGRVNVSESSTPAYEVEIAIDPAGATLLNGAATEVTIDVAAASEVLTVPLSALHVDGTSYTVQRLVDGELTSVPVEVGAIGSERVEITDGLAVGDEVVIADLSADITSDTSTTTSGIRGGQGDVGSGGFGGGTFTGGGQGGPPTMGG